MMAAVAEEVRDGMRRAIPLGRFGEPREVAEQRLQLVPALEAILRGEPVAGYSMTPPPRHASSR